MYDAMLLIHPSKPIDLGQLRLGLETFYARQDSAPEIVARGNQLMLKFEGFVFLISFESGEQVLIESREIAQRHATDRSDRKAIAECSSRFSIEGKGEDDEMARFNDFVEIVECAERAGLIFQFDAVAGKVVTEDAARAKT
jgi:hypothetical protein